MRLSTKLKNLYSQNYCYLTGNATTAIYLTLCALGLKKKNI